MRGPGGATNIEAGAHSVRPATGPAPAAGGAVGLLVDLAVRQCLLPFSDGGVCHAAVAEPKYL